MKNNSYNAAIELLRYFNINRGVGHTTAMLDGANANSIIIAHTHEWAEQLADKTDATCLSLGALTTGILRGNCRPLVLDNSATIALLSDLVTQVEGLKIEVKSLRGKIERAKAALE